MLRQGSRPTSALMSRLAPFTKRSWGLIVLVVGLFFALWVAPARAENVQLAYGQVPTCQGNSCITPIAPGSGKDMPSKWTWFAVDPARLQRMPVGWNLVIDNVRFTAIEIRVVHEGGVAVIRRGQFELSRNWTMGNNLRFQIPVAGPDVTAIQIGYAHGWLGLCGAARQPGDLVLSGWLAAGAGRAGVAHLPQLQPAAAG